MQVVGGKSALGISFGLLTTRERERGRGRELVVNLPNFIAKEHNNN
jgi:hypothetical protein